MTSPHSAVAANGQSGRGDVAPDCPHGLPVQRRDDPLDRRMAGDGCIVSEQICMCYAPVVLPGWSYHAGRRALHDQGDWEEAGRRLSGIMLVEVPECPLLAKVGT